MNSYSMWEVGVLLRYLNNKYDHNPPGGQADSWGVFCVALLLVTEW